MTPRMFYTLARVLAALTVIPFHEAGHALAAWLLGDPTAKQQGRLSLNPFRHFDLLGTLCMVFAGVGWAKPVSTDPRNFKNPAGHGPHGAGRPGGEPHPGLPCDGGPGSCSIIGRPSTDATIFLALVPAIP